MASSASNQPAAAKPAATYSTDPALYIYTSLTAGSSHIVTATSRLETILRANRIPFKAIDMATDEKARMLWGRRAGKDESGRMRKLPGLVQEGLILGDLVEIEEWNEYGELKQHVKIFYDDFTQPSISQAPKLPPVQPKRAVPPAAASAAAAGAVAAAKAAAGAAPKPPPAPPAPEKKATPAVAKGPPKPGATTTLPVLSVAEEAAAKAKQIRLQGLRDKVYGKGNSGPADSKPKEAEAAGKAGAEKEAAEVKKPTAISLASAAPKTAGAAAKVDAGLQSPTSGAWKGGSSATGGPASSEDLLRTLQSPTSTAWKPTDVDPPVTSHRGSLVSPASPEEIEAVEKELAIKEEPEEEEEEEDDDDDDDDDDDEEDTDEDSEDDDDEEEEEEPKKTTAAAPAKSAEPAKDKKTPESKDTKA
ncbi:hypothetical protein RB595_000888 [Gaeumannomyces hyphopodioides]